ncbi:uncharacterized protein TRAVEDRAFT_50601 [Trametes versicolor FP-101664 SS1]|uniref:uncharacterized protein n=1 Tax=Trametes versicolor (strain FP-101664) TaxID=717944 RepID=UPI0004623117|nr:uncharacterized protein TRAVEDRAFT_50601 [Trametes versicolor FP-101664 SS1]EIW56113.1 hypothetical protein TRAVEDRAFT_50601 [Trametes versicolor FP-101664 SS1]
MLALGPRFTSAFSSASIVFVDPGTITHCTPACIGTSDPFANASISSTSITSITDFNNNLSPSITVTPTKTSSSNLPVLTGTRASTDITSVGTIISNPPASHSGPPNNIIIPVAIVSGLSFVAAALFLAVCIHRRRRRRRVVQGVSQFRNDDTQPQRTCVAMAEHSEVSTSNGVTSAMAQQSAGAEDDGSTSGQDGSALSQSGSDVLRPWAASSQVKGSRRSPSYTHPGPNSNEEFIRAQTQIPPARRDAPSAPSTEADSTVLLRLPAGLAQGIMALVAGANAGAVRYAGESENGQDSESLPAYESEPSGSEVNTGRSS